MKKPLITASFVLALVLGAGSAAGDCLFTSDTTSVDNQVSAFRVGAAGGLDPASGSPVSTGGPSSLRKATESVARLGGWVYVVNSGRSWQEPGSLAGFRVDRGCNLHPLPGSPWPLGRFDLAGVEVDPSKRLLFVTSFADDTVETLRVSHSGVPTSVALLETRHGEGPFDVVLAPNGAWLYVAHFNSARVGVYEVLDSGELVPTDGSPYPLPAQFFNGLTVSPDGRLLYGVDSRNSRVHGFEVESDGTLTPIPGTPWSTVPPGPFNNSGVIDALVMPDGEHLVVSSQDDSFLSVFAIGVAGDLEEVEGSPFPASAQGGGGLTTSPSGSIVYLTNGGRGSLGEPWGRNSVAAYAFEGGQLSPLGDPLGLEPGHAAGLLYFHEPLILEIPAQSEVALWILAALLAMIGCARLARVV